MKERREVLPQSNKENTGQATAHRQNNEQSIEQQTKKPTFNPKNFGLFVFKPRNSRFRESFYTMPFKKRLGILKENIIVANEYSLQRLSTNPDFKSMLVGPEYLFKKHHKKGCNQYYSQRKKEKFVRTLAKLSQHTEMIIAPGTICWQEEANPGGETYYHNEIYFFYKGKVINYNKTYPHPLDCQYIGNKTTTNKRYFKTGVSDSPILRLNGVSIGVEICLDNAYMLLDSKINPNPYLTKAKRGAEKIDLHLLVADGIKRPNLIAQSGLLFFKVERTSKYKTKIGTVSSENPRVSYLKETPPVPLNKTLTFYKP
ncbi:hypothetical protein Lnau_2862 [Legionella nautarum]|uniref:CN hydrolase domain-containing protein n=1 Tax=Legionella nautarum TaxID=45070 RepID=A0A0W0WLL8_9GAMM|nr:hypothetical protein [Legionella nautarum]KTD33214.1 hypothetical protein Lnau_2862 [Legionella nautarum]